MTKDERNLVRDLLSVGNLSDWSINFLDNLESKYWEPNTPLTERQLSKLQELAKKEGLIE